MNQHRLEVWRKSMDLCIDIYTLTKNLPTEEKFGLISQMRRSATSIPSNISEGHGRKSNGQFRQFLYIAKGSISELNTQLLICLHLGYINQKQFLPFRNRYTEVEKMISGLIKKL